jgi:Predicted AAA-ATPase/PD-(D/E)XK nuclease superfamily
LLEKGVITGNLTLAKAGIFSGLNNVDIYNVTRAHMSDKFGFTSHEMDELLSYYDLEDKKVDIKEWYNGYSFGTTQHMYNPWSAIKCIANKGELDPYWASTSDNILLKNLIGSSSESVKIDLETLFKNGTITHRIEESIVFPDLATREDLIWSLLLYTGYLTFTHYEIIDDMKQWHLKIPNKEIRLLLTNLITDMFSDAVVSGKVQTLLRAFVSGNVEVFAPLLQNYILTSMSSFDITTEPEKSYHMFILGMLLMLRASYDVKSNGESGFGRYDILVIPKKKTKTGIIVEFKKVWPQSKETLETASQKALDQIIKKNYTLELENLGIRTVIAYGLAFEKRAIAVKCARFEQGKEVACEE